MANTHDSTPTPDPTPLDTPPDTPEGAEAVEPTIGEALVHATFALHQRIDDLQKTIDGLVTATTAVLERQAHVQDVVNAVLTQVHEVPDYEGTGRLLGQTVKLLLTAKSKSA